MNAAIEISTKPAKPHRPPLCDFNPLTCFAKQQNKSLYALNFGVQVNF